MITINDIRFKWIKGYGFTDMHCNMMRDNSLGIQREEFADKDKWGQLKKSRIFYFIDGVDKEFTDLDKLVDFYNEKFRSQGGSEMCNGSESF